LEQRASFDFGFAFIFLAALHGFSGLKVMAILFANYCIATRLPRKYVPAATWIFNISTLFANELSDGYKFTKIAAYLSPLPPGLLESDSLIHSWGAWLDSHGGIMPRWEILFNLTVLRLISFNLDYYWSLDRRGGSPVEVCCTDLALVLPWLMLIRRNNSTLQTSPKETASQSQQTPKNTAFATTLHMRSTLPYTSLDQL
jgi:hypothetical protein